MNKKKMKDQDNRLVVKINKINEIKEFEMIKALKYYLFLFNNYFI